MNPFKIICGTSVGAVNAAALASFADNLEAGTEHLLDVWSNFRGNHVYRSDLPGDCKRTISLISQEKVRDAGLSLRKIDVMVISPSEPIERFAVRYLGELPCKVGLMLRGVGAMSGSGSNLASYLLFERGFCRALIDLGYQDTMARRTEMEAFLALVSGPTVGMH